MNFDDLIGNDKIKKILKNSLQNNNLVHSYMFIGTDGIGKNSFAQDFAQMIMCLAENKACGICKSCVEFENANNPDCIQIESDGKVIKIDQIREMQEKVIEKPIISNKKIYIINDADLMTKEAQNCLLKTLEEPPEYIIMILVVTNESNILPTIKSRCMKIGFSKLEKDTLANYIKQTLKLENLSQNILDMCDGSIGKSIKIVENINNYQEIEKIINNIEKMDKIDLLNSSEILYKSKDDIINYLEYINVILYNKFINTKNSNFINSIDIVEKTRKNLNSNSNYDMSIDNLLLKLWEEINEEYCWS